MVNPLGLRAEQHLFLGPALRKRPPAIQGYQASAEEGRSLARTLPLEGTFTRL